MEIVIDFSQIGANPLAAAWWFFKTIGWIFPAIFFIQGLLVFWKTYLRSQYRQTRKYILLAIDVPKENEQTPKAVENIFNHLAGAHKPLRFVDKWWFGEIPESFSFPFRKLLRVCVNQPHVDVAELERLPVYRGIRAREPLRNLLVARVVVGAHLLHDNPALVVRSKNNLAHLTHPIISSLP